MNLSDVQIKARRPCTRCTDEMVREVGYCDECSYGWIEEWISLSDAMLEVRFKAISNEVEDGRLVSGTAVALTQAVDEMSVRIRKAFFIAQRDGTNPVPTYSDLSFQKNFGDTSLFHFARDLKEQGIVLRVGTPSTSLLKILQRAGVLK